MIDLSRQDQIEPQTTQLDELNGSTDQDITEKDQLTEKQVNSIKKQNFTISVRFQIIFTKKAFESR